MNKNLFVFLSCLFLTIFAAESIAKPGMIIVFNGTSSAGKSSLCKAIQNITGESFCIESMDDFSIKYYNCEHNEKCCKAFYGRVKKLAESGQNILVDTMLYEDDYLKYIPLLGAGVIKILVYCPFDIVIDHCVQRNKSHDIYEHRVLPLVLSQFLKLYNLSSLMSESVIDQMNRAQLNNYLNKAEQEVCGDKKLIKLHKQLVKEFTQYFKTSDQIMLSPKNQHDFIVNTGADSSLAAAQKIIEFINAQSTVTKLSI